MPRREATLKRSQSVANFMKGRTSMYGSAAAAGNKAAAADANQSEQIFIPPNTPVEPSDPLYGVAPHRMPVSAPSSTDAAGGADGEQAACYRAGRAEAMRAQTDGVVSGAADKRSQQLAEEEEATGLMGSLGRLMGKGGATPNGTLIAHPPAHGAATAAETKELRREVLSMRAEVGSLTQQLAASQQEHAHALDALKRELLDGFASLRDMHSANLRA